MFELGKAIVVIPEELDKYSAPKLKRSAMMKGRIFLPILSCSLQRDFSVSVVVCSVVSEADGTIVYSTSIRPSGPLVI